MQRRRAFLGALGTAAVGGLAGCTSLGAGGGTEPTTADPEKTLAGHPAAVDLADEPLIGAPLSESGDVDESDDSSANRNSGSSGDVIVGFEDPSCTTCRRFEENTWPQLAETYLDTGAVTFAYRVYPITYAWGKPAVQAMEATFARSADAFWALKDHYYAEQGRFDTDTVLDLTAAFLNAETGVDGDAVAADAAAKAYDAKVQADLAAGDEAVVFSTPTFFLFTDGVFRTTVTGAKDFAVFEAVFG